MNTTSGGKKKLGLLDAVRIFGYKHTGQKGSISPKSTPKQRVGKKTMQQGWECPKCGSVYAIWVDSCTTCRNSNVRIVISDGTYTK